MSIKNLQFYKKGIGIESQNLCKQFNDQKTIETTQSYGGYRRKVMHNSVLLGSLKISLDLSLGHLFTEMYDAKKGGPTSV